MPSPLKSPTIGKPRSLVVELTGGHHDALRAGLRIGLREVDLEEPELRAVEQGEFVAVGGVAVEIAGDANAVGLEGFGHGEGDVALGGIDDAVAIDVDQPAEGADR